MKTLNDVCVDLWGWVQAAPTARSKATRGALVGLAVVAAGLALGFGVVVAAIWVANLILSLGVWVLTVVALCIAVSWISLLLCSINVGEDDATPR